jgi:hypothetical protein
LAKGSTTIESRAASAGAFVATLAGRFAPRHAVAHQVVVALLHNIAEMNADPEFDALVWRDLGVALERSPTAVAGLAGRSSTRTAKFARSLLSRR